MTIVVKTGKFIASIIYSIIKLFPVKNKITLISRQSNTPSIDFILLEEEIKRQNNKCKVVVLTKKMGNGLLEKVAYCLHMLKQMYHIATSRGVIVDSYCIPISIFKHRKNLIIIQVWHALGAIKKFGYASLGKEEGSSEQTAKLMDMHKNYTYVISGSKEMIPFFAEAFNVDKKIIKPYSMPRVDYLLNNKKNKSTEIKKKIFKEYEMLKRKKNILYAPTFRTDCPMQAEDLIKNIDFEKYNLIIKKHPEDKAKIESSKNIIVDKKFGVMDLLFVSDYLISDYSAVAFEASVLSVPMFFYVYDIEKYKNNRGLFVDYYREMPGIISKNAKDIINAIETNNYSDKKIEEFRKKYVSVLDATSTNKIINLLGVGEVKNAKIKDNIS